MADYWVSGKKKYCEICKIWYADNKISIENHERGQGHKINVQKRLRDMGRLAKEREAEVIWIFYITLILFVLARSF